MRALRLYGTDADFRVETGRRLATNASPCRLIYTAKVEDPASFDSGFTYALIYAIASHLAVVLAANRALQEQLKMEADKMLKEARQQDGQEGTAYKIRNRNSWPSYRNRRT